MDVNNENIKPIITQTREVVSTFISTETTEKVKSFAMRSIEAAGWGMLGKAVGSIPTPGAGLLKDGVKIFHKFDGTDKLRKSAATAGWGMLGKTASLIPTPGADLIKSAVKIVYTTSSKNNLSRVKERQLRQLRKMHLRAASTDGMVTGGGRTIRKPTHVKEREEHLSQLLQIAVGKEQRKRRTHNVEAGIKFAGKVSSNITGEKILTPKLVRYIQASYRLYAEEDVSCHKIWQKVEKATVSSGIEGAKEIGIYTIKQIVGKGK